MRKPVIKLKRIISFVILLLTFILVLSGCSFNKQEQISGEGTINLMITKDFGTKTVLEKQIPYKKDISVIDLLLESGAEIDTAYGGNFIKGINGLKSNSAGISGTRYDWFYYINGIFAEVGALDYLPEPDEVIWWDYHPWKMATGSANAVIGAYPEPFVHGVRGEENQITYIMCLPEEKELALNLEKALKTKGVQEIEITKIEDDLLENRKGPTILLGAWEKIKHTPYVEKVNNNYPKNGTALHFTNDSLELLNYQGKIVKKLQGNVGVITATGSGGANNPLWVVSGLDEQGFKKALDILITHPEKISGMYSGVVFNDEVISLPLLGE